MNLRMCPWMYCLSSNDESLVWGEFDSIWNDVLNKVNKIICSCINILFINHNFDDFITQTLPIRYGHQSRLFK
jgi:hypothetical protein